MAVLAHIVSGEWIRFDTQKIGAVKSWPRPTSLSDISSFFGLAGYYIMFGEGYLSILYPLTKLYKKTIMFQWSEACQKKLSKIEKEVD